MDFGEGPQEQVVGELVGCVLVCGLGAGVNVAFGACDLDPAEPRGLFVVGTAVEIDRPILEGAAIEVGLGLAGSILNGLVAVGHSRLFARFFGRRRR